MIILITSRFLNDCDFKLHLCNKLNHDPQKKEDYIKWCLVFSIIGFEFSKDMKIVFNTKSFFYLDPFLTYRSLLINNHTLSIHVWDIKFWRGEIH